MIYLLRPDHDNAGFGDVPCPSKEEAAWLASRIVYLEYTNIFIEITETEEEYNEEMEKIAVEAENLRTRLLAAPLGERVEWDSSSRTFTYFTILEEE